MFEDLFADLAARWFTKTFSPPDPEQLTIDYSNAESVLFAACILDQHGEWERAIELFRHAMTQWPDEHGTYATNSIQEIQKNSALGNPEK